ncbi:MAG: substrate-binding domain-containing protein [Syntrophobacteraceae bacterium]
MRARVLAVLIVAFILGGSVGDGYSEEGQVRYLGSVTMKIGLIDKVAPIMKQKQNLNINADASGATSEGVRAVIDGNADIVGSGGSFSKDAISRGITPTLIGSDILGVAVHKDNPVKGLTREQLKNIFNGSITNWSQVGGADAPIIVFTMDKISAGYEIFKDVILEKGNFSEKAAVMRVPMYVAQNVAKVPEGIGFCSLCFMQREPSLKVLAIDGQEASSDNPQYPLTRALYWGTRGAPTGNAKVLVDFVLSEEGQAIVKQSFVGAQDTKRLGHRN